MTIDMEKVMELVLAYLPKVAMALVTLIVGLWIIGIVVRFVRRRLLGTDIEESLAGFLTSVLNIFLKIMLLLSVVGQFGVNTTSFIAIFSALMVGVGMALNGTIGHFASGVMLMIFKPFKVGDIVDIGGGHRGKVEAINAFNTTLETLDNQRIIVANSNVTGNTITNVTGQGVIGVELTFGIGYNDSIDEARKIILQVGSSCKEILKDPAQGVVVAELADSSVNLATRPFCKSEDYWTVYFYMQEQVKKEFDQNGISIPYPQMDVHSAAQS